ncbi:hypothetical protein ACFVXH_41230, partial [Kitasatospora sp. NPDC058184]|uniref:hypothetical protein n=1 Tax=Kitasatospora sp. NPDC058184 TaxID=3346370 RepID=UPI0036DBEA17
RAKYCSDACRAAASRERARQRHAQEVEAARLQAALDLKTPQETLAEIVQELEATTRIIRDRGDVPASLRPLVNAASALVNAAQQGAAPASSSNRKTRRAVKRSFAPKTR